MTKAGGQQVEKHALAKRYYVCVYIEANYIAVKRETVSKEAVYIAVGIGEDGSKKVLTYAVASIESACME
jgi:putative transposase